MAEDKLYISRMLTDLTAKMVSMEAAMTEVATQIVAVAQNTSQTVASLKIKSSNTFKCSNASACGTSLNALSGLPGTAGYALPLKFKSLCAGTCHIQFNNCTLPTGNYCIVSFCARVGAAVYLGTDLVVPISFGDIIEIGVAAESTKYDYTEYCLGGNIPVGGIRICYDLTNIVSEGGIISV